MKKFNFVNINKIDRKIKIIVVLAVLLLTGLCGFEYFHTKSIVQGQRSQFNTRYMQDKNKLAKISKKTSDYQKVLSSENKLKKQIVSTKFSGNSTQISSTLNDVNQKQTDLSKQIASNTYKIIRLQQIKVFANKSKKNRNLTEKQRSKAKTLLSKAKKLEQKQTTLSTTKIAVSPVTAVINNGKKSLASAQALEKKEQEAQQQAEAKAKATSSSSSSEASASNSTTSAPKATTSSDSTSASSAATTQGINFNGIHIGIGGSFSGSGEVPADGLAHLWTELPRYYLLEGKSVIYGQYMTNLLLSKLSYGTEVTINGSSYHVYKVISIPRTASNSFDEVSSELNTGAIGIQSCLTSDSSEIRVWFLH